MGPQGKRWPKWKQRRDNSKEEVTRENREKKLHYGVKCIRKALKKARAFEERKIVRRLSLATAAAAGAAASSGSTKTTPAGEKKGSGSIDGGGGTVKPSAKPSSTGGGPDAEKLSEQLAAVKALDVDALGEHMGRVVFDAVLASRDVPSAEKALPADGDGKEAEGAVGQAAVRAAGTHHALVVARRLLAAACVREEVTALQEKLVLVGDRQEWAKGRLAREELRRQAKEEHRAAKEAAAAEERRREEEAKARTRSRGSGDVDVVNRTTGAIGEDDAKEASEGDGDGPRDELLDEDDWSSGGEENGRPDVSDSEGEDSDSDDIVIRNDEEQLQEFLAEVNGVDTDGTGAASDDSDSDDESDPDEELPPELARILGVEQKPKAGKYAGQRGRDKKKTATAETAPLKKEKKPKKRMGQRARRLLAEQIHGQNANHIKQEREEQERRVRQAREQEQNMHPSWAAKRAAANALAAAPRGAKVTFGDGENDGSSRGGRGGGRGGDGGRGRGGGRGGDGGRGGGRGTGREDPPRKEKGPRAPKVYIGEIKGGTGEVVGKVTKPMGPSGAKDEAKMRPKSVAGRSSGSGYGKDYDAEEAAAAHPAWAAKRKAAQEAWGSVKPEGKKIKFDD